MEKKLEAWLRSEEYQALISTRRKNRVYFESEMLKAVENELYYEDLYKETGEISIIKIDEEKVRGIIRYDVSDNIVNTLLGYPLANILSEYLINSQLELLDNELFFKCLDADLREVINDYLPHLGCNVQYAKK